MVALLISLLVLFLQIFFPWSLCSSNHISLPSMTSLPLQLVSFPSLSCFFFFFFNFFFCYFSSHLATFHDLPLPISLFPSLSHISSFQLKASSLNQLKDQLERVENLANIYIQRGVGYVDRDSTHVTRNPNSKY